MAATKSLYNETYINPLSFLVYWGLRAHPQLRSFCAPTELPVPTGGALKPIARA